MYGRLFLWEKCVRGQKPTFSSYKNIFKKKLNIYKGKRKKWANGQSLYFIKLEVIE